MCVYVCVIRSINLIPVPDRANPVEWIIVTVGKNTWHRIDMVHPINNQSGERDLAALKNSSLDPFP